MTKFIIAFTSAILISFGALAQGQCGPYEKLQDHLASPPLSEQVRYIGTFGEIGIMELWLNPVTGSFTLVGRPLSNPEIGCVIAGGDNWRDATTPKHLPGKGA